MKNVVVTARIPGALSASLDALAGDLDRPRSWIVAKAIERYVAEEGELIAAIRVGEADLDAGRTHTQQEVEAMFGVKRDRRNAA
jgi:predicted transcriptional regulator